jgi:hypothetical protein
MSSVRAPVSVVSGEVRVRRSHVINSHVSNRVITVSNDAFMNS